MNIRHLARYILAAFALVFFASVINPSGAAGADKALRPNIVFIMADDLGYGDLGCYGQRRIETPHVDRMAAEGLRFLDCYAGSTVCAPSRCCLMTGLHTGHARVRGNARVPLEPSDVTVAELLKGQGYVTGMFGKWGLGEPDSTGIPNRQGFDEWFGYLNQGHAHNYYPEYLWHNTEKYPLSGNLDGAKEQYSHDLIVRRAEHFLREQGDAPFFLYVPLTLPHANNELGRATGNGMEVPDDAPYSDRPWPQPQKNHAAMITRMDQAVGRLLALIEERDLDERTIVFFTSDNGTHKEGGADPEFFNSSGPLRGYKRDLYEGGIRVPMIVRFPYHVKGGATSDVPWAFWDVLPTLAELAGAPVTETIDGISMLPTILGEDGAGHSQAPHEYLYWEFHERGSRQAVRIGHWKAVRLQTGAPLELYDLKTDVGETSNVAAGHPKIVAQVEAILADCRTESPHWPLKPRPRARRRD